LQKIGNLLGQFSFNLGGKSFAIENSRGQSSDPFVKPGKVGEILGRTRKN
jgi:hypothetical protein